MIEKKGVIDGTFVTPSTATGCQAGVGCGWASGAVKAEYGGDGDGRTREPGREARDAAGGGAGMSCLVGVDACGRRIRMGVGALKTGYQRPTAGDERRGGRRGKRKAKGVACFV
jgi:hypothetical protein